MSIIAGVPSDSGANPTGNRAATALGVLHPRMPSEIAAQPLFPNALSELTPWQDRTMNVFVGKVSQTLPVLDALLLLS